MTNSQLLDHASALRKQGKFQEAYDTFLEAAKNTDDALEKVRILLHATTNLTQLHDFKKARAQLAEIRELLSVLNHPGLSSDGFYFGTIGVEVEQAEILAAEDDVEGAIQKLTQILEEFKLKLQEPQLEVIS
jgi:tetratricopeptide (TPR) repeat protein